MAFSFAKVMGTGNAAMAAIMVCTAFKLARVVSAAIKTFAFVTWACSLKVNALKEALAATILASSLRVIGDGKALIKSMTSMISANPAITASSANKSA